MIYSSPLMKLSAGWEAVEPHLSSADDFSVKGVLRFLAPTLITPEEENKLTTMVRHMDEG
jgi:hypothetical protein